MNIIKNQSNKKNILMYIFIGAFSLVLMLILNHYTLLAADDFSYCFSFDDETRINSLRSIFESMSAHRKSVNGRVVPHTIVQLLLWGGIGKPIFNVLNSFVFTWFGIAIFLISNKKETRKPSRLLAIFLILFTLLPDFGQTVLWLDGSCNYLWGTTVIVSFLVFFQYRFWEIKKFDSAASILLITILAFFAGSWSENTSLAMIILELMYIIFVLIKNKKVPIFYITSIISSSVGWLLMISAPANNSRLSILNDDSVSFVEKLFGRADTAAAMMRQHLYVFIFMIFLLLVVGILVKTCRKARIINDVAFDPTAEKIILTFIWILAALAANFAMIGTPYYPARASIGAVTFMIIATCIFASQFKLKKMNVVIIVIAVLFYASTFGLLFSSSKSLIRNYNATSVRNEEILQMIESGEKNIRISSCASDSSYCIYGLDGDIYKDPSHWVNIAKAKFYNVDSIARNGDIVIEQTRVEKYKKMLFGWIFG